MYDLEKASDDGNRIVGPGGPHESVVIHGLVGVCETKCMLRWNSKHIWLFTRIHNSREESDRLWSPHRELVWSVWVLGRGE